MTEEMTRSWIDLDGRYRLLGGARVVPRPDDELQIGTEPPQCVILHDAPPEAASVLRRLDGRASIASVLAEFSCDQLIWRGLLTELQTAGLLVPVGEWAFAIDSGGAGLENERSALAHRHGPAAARRRWQSRQDAVVVIDGRGRLAGTLASVLTASGVGRVYRQFGDEGRPDRARPAALAAPPARDPAPAWLPAQRRGRPPEPVRLDQRPEPGPPPRGTIPTVVVFADTAPPAPWAASRLLDQRVPHLSVLARLTSAVLGPLVLPGRSTCLLCVLRHRNEIDLGWTVVEAGLRVEPEYSTAALSSTVAAAAAVETLTLVDGEEEPGSVDGTIEWSTGELVPRRRSWQRHPECQCATVSGP